MDNIELEQEINKIYDSLYSRAFSKLKNKENVEDVIADTMFAILKNHQKLKDKNKFKAWAFKILDHECIRFYKKREEDKIIFDKVKDYVESEDSSSIERVESNRDFEELIKVLDENEKRIFRLYYNDRNSLNKISKTLDENPNTVKSIFWRGKKKLKAEFKNLVLILLIFIIFASSVTIAGVIINQKIKNKNEYKFYYNNEQIDEIKYEITNNKLKLKIDFNENKINQNNFEIYLENNPIYLISMDKSQNIVYPTRFEWLENDIFEIEFDCNEDILGSNTSVHIVLSKGESITILLKK